MFIIPPIFLTKQSEKILIKRLLGSCGDPIKLDQIPERIYIFSGIFYAAFFSLYSIGLKYPNFSFILSLL